MINKVGYDACVTCRACMAACPKQCISFADEYESFLYPVIDNDKCVQCGLCEKVCPANQEMSRNLPRELWAAKSKDNAIKKMSSSGGIFYVIADAFIRGGGVVVGAAFDEQFRVKHVVAETTEQLVALCGSKYVQSDVSFAYGEIKNYLLQGEKVLFVGTSCQTAAIATSFQNNRNRDNLFLIDFICHGIVSEQVFEHYLAYLKKKYRSAITSFAFRNKNAGWLNSGVVVQFENGKTYHAPLSKDLYMQGYFHNLNLRASCASCAYKDGKSQSDLTLGDFWGVESLYPEFYDYYGNSVVICNTQLGEILMKTAWDKIDCIPIQIHDVLKYNMGFAKPFPASDDRDAYFMEAKRKGYIIPLEKYLYGTGVRYLKNRAKQLLRGSK